MGAPPQGLTVARYHTVAPECRCASQQKLCADVADGSFSTDTPETAGPFASAMPPIPTTNSRHWCLSAAPRNDLLHCETDLQDLAVRVLRAGDHQADGCGAGLIAWNRQSAAVEQIDDCRIAQHAQVEASPTAPGQRPAGIRPTNI